LLAKNHPFMHPGKDRNEFTHLKPLFVYKKFPALRSSFRKGLGALPSGGAVPLPGAGILHGGRLIGPSSTLLYSLAIAAKWLFS
ncbi:MAG: hypothetical protein ABIM40_02770, partial [Pseudomonadota bacterium]